MGAFLLSSTAHLHLVGGITTAHSSTSTSALRSLFPECQPAPTLPSTRLPNISALCPLTFPVVSSSEQKRESVRGVSIRRSFEEELEDDREGESGLGRNQKNNLTVRTRRCSCCPRAAAARNSSSSLQWPESLVTMDDRRQILQQKGCIVWITGLSGSGKSTVAFAMERILNSMAKMSYVLDGDKIREGLCKDLGFSAEDRRENIRRVGETAALFADAGLIAVVSFISPYKRDRDRVRELVPTGSFVEVFMDVPLAVCEERDAKGLYKLARQGVIKAFTGIDDPYEKPVNPEIVIRALNEHGVCISPDEMAWIIIHYLTDKGFLSAE